MIQPNELRQGNYVLEGLTLIQIDFRNNDFWHTENFNPIPLTPEVLEKCKGFDRKTPNLFSGFGIVVLFDSESVKVGIHISWEMYHTLKEGQVKCLHQIQNIVFDLSGEELEYKP